MTSRPHPALSSPPAHPLRLRLPLLTSRCRRRLPLLRSASPSPPRAAAASPWSLSPSLTRSSFTVAPASRRAGARSLVSRPRAVADPMGGEAPEPRRLSRALRFGCGGIPDEALHLVMGYVDDPRDREAASLVCRRWHRIDALTRKHVTVAFYYAADPSRLCARFPRLESLALKGRPRAAMYGLIPEDWGAYAVPWVSELAEPLECLKALHLRRMTVTDADLAALVRARGHMLQEFKLDKCSGFSTDALRLVARSCS